MIKDLESLSRKELEKLSRDVDKALEHLKKQDMKKAREAASKAAAAHGFTLSDLVGGAAAAKTPRKAKGKSPMKYANPEDTTQKWTGKGRQPNWFKSAISAGKSPESMEI